MLPLDLVGCSFRRHSLRPARWLVLHQMALLLLLFLHRQQQHRWWRSLGLAVPQFLRRHRRPSWLVGRHPLLPLLPYLGPPYSSGPVSDSLGAGSANDSLGFVGGGPAGSVSPRAPPGAPVQKT